jgi:cell division protein FtsX
MLSRITYTFRETWASFRRNMTLTVAAIITSAVSLLIFGLTLLMQQGFDNMLLQWSDDVEMVIYVNPGATPEQLAVIQGQLDELPQQIDNYTYCDAECALGEAQTLLAGDPSSLQLLTAENIPTNFKVKPTDATQSDALSLLRDSLRDLPNVGATDWFIRLPFMLEGLIQGFIGGLAACGGLWLINDRWTAGVSDFPPKSGFAQLVVSDGFLTGRMLILLGIGMVAGAIGAGIAASRFLDV